MSHEVGSIIITGILQIMKLGLSENLLNITELIKWWSQDSNAGLQDSRAYTLKHWATLRLQLPSSTLGGSKVVGTSQDVEVKYEI